MMESSRAKHTKKNSDTSRQQWRPEDDLINSSGWWGSRQADSRVRNTSGERGSVLSGSITPSPNYTARNKTYKQIPPIVGIDDSKRLRMEKEELSAKCNILMNKLRELAPETDDSLYQLIEHTDARIQHLEENMRAKRERILSHYKQKTLNLLERFGYKAIELSLENVRTQAELIELMIGKLMDRELQAQSVILAKQDEADQARTDMLRMQDQLERCARELKMSRAEQEKLRLELEQARGELSSMAKTLNGRRIQQSLKVERERISLDRERVSEDAHRTKMSMKEMEQHFYDKVATLERRNRELQAKLAAVTKELIDERLKTSDCKLRIEELHTELEQARQHIRIEQDATDKMQRDALRWKERFEQIEKRQASGERGPPIEYRSRQQPLIDRNKTITKTEASGLYDRKVLAPDDRTLGLFLDKEIKKLETDLHRKGLLTVPSKLTGSRVQDQ